MQEFCLDAGLASLAFWGFVAELLLWLWHC